MSKIFGMVVWQFIHDVSQDFELGMECVLSREKYLLSCGSFGVF